jgi:hypothetical protein
MAAEPKSIATCSNGITANMKAEPDKIHAQRPDWQLFRDGCPGGESPQQLHASLHPRSIGARVHFGPFDGWDIPARNQHVQAKALYAFQTGPARRTMLQVIGSKPPLLEHAGRQSATKMSLPALG